MSAAARPLSGGTGVPTAALGAWQPEPDEPPAGAADAQAGAHHTTKAAAAMAKRVVLMLRNPSGRHGSRRSAPTPSLRAKRSNPGCSAVSGLLRRLRSSQ